MLQFDKNGFLTPYESIVCDWDTFRIEFAEKPHHLNRRELFSQLVRFFGEMFEAVNLTELKIWVNGSFTTSKPNPNDIDLVYFLEKDLAERYEKQLSEQFSYPESLQLYGIDAYLVKVFKETHSNFIRTKSDTLYWMNQFTKTRINRRGQVFKKGFLEIQLHESKIR